VQSGSEEMLHEFHRPVPKRRAMEAAAVIEECGVDCFFDLISKVHFEREEHCRDTFDFLVDFPRSVQCVGFGAMVSFPKFGYTTNVAERNATLALSDEDYRYYHKLYYLTRTRLPRRLVRMLGRSRTIRRHPSLLDPLLPKKLPFFFLGDVKDFSPEVLDAPHSQAIIPGGELDRGWQAETSAAAS